MTAPRLDWHHRAATLAAVLRRPVWLAFHRYGQPTITANLDLVPVSPTYLFRITPDGSVHRAL